MQVENKGKNKIVMEKELAKFREDLYVVFLRNFSHADGPVFYVDIRPGVFMYM